MNRLLLPSPIGPLLAEYDDAGLRALRFWLQGEHPPAGTRADPGPHDGVGKGIARELREYFAGERRAFGIPLAAEGSEFQRRVWAALRAIPCGETRSYGELARALGRPGAARAVGQANARNPLPVVVPCHRVLAAGGGLGGYMGDWGGGEGARIKRWLLAHEARIGSKDG